MEKSISVTDFWKGLPSLAETFDQPWHKNPGTPGSPEQIKYALHPSIVMCVAWVLLASQAF